MSDPKDTAAVTPEATEAAPAAAPVVDEVAAKLQALGLSDETITKIKNDLGVGSVDDLNLLTEQDLKDVGVKPIEARKLLAALKPIGETLSTDPSTAYASVLPSVPDYKSLIEMLRTGGALKIEPSTVVGVVQAWVASKAGLFDINQRIAEEMLAYAKRNDEPVDSASYYKLKSELTRNRYGDLFAAIEGFDGRSVTAASKKELLTGFERTLVPAIRTFQSRLDGWHEAWLASYNNPLAFQNALTAMAGGRTGVMPTVSQAPDVAGLRDEAESFNDAANRVFAGEGVQVAAAVAFEAGKVRSVLLDPALPARIGAANHEQMLKQLGISVSAADPRFERNLVQYVLAILQVKNVGSGREELLYFDALWQLGGQLDWSQLGGGRLGTSDLGRIALDLSRTQDYRPQDRRL